MKPNDILTLDIQSVGEDGDGISKLGKTTVYVSNALPGERVSAVVDDVAKSYAHAPLQRIISCSQHRVKANCLHVRQCGGGEV